MNASLKILCLFFTLYSFDVFAQPVTPGEHGLKEFRIEDKKLGTINFYVDTTNLKSKSPLFIETNGSGGMPLCLYIKGQKFVTTYTSYSSLLLDKTKDKFHYVILGKPGTAFCDTLSLDMGVEEFQKNGAKAVMLNYRFSPEYTKRLSLYWRVEATKVVVSYLIKHGFWDRTKLVAYGYSEGGQVVPALAVAEKRITHVISVVGSGLNQFYGDILEWRIKAQRGEISQQGAQDSIVSYMAKVTDIYKNPNNVTKEFGGHSYKRWASFGSSIPFEKPQKVKYTNLLN
ncbi:alpha/beta hydrolase family protein [Pedobacter steynii]